ncbi:hypothetical protein AYL99_11059 [Fonsecaea erecta]|uniref:Uncharacterized protein n=1 Tax=Fonsecaea erecta TaxID=1367422 RepID=A0A178Z517_9EURO|nr:hypothetical protein AYL99_11059 [Fonsecaea erecta]OAP54611.1 hypothetical protein AYL99_11059 [Fonsecaea erecta]
MAEFGALKPAPSVLMSEECKKKRELEVTDAEDDQLKKRRTSKQVHWDLAPMPPSAAYSAPSASGGRDLPNPSGLPRFLEIEIPDASYGKPPCKRQGSPRPWTTDFAYRQPRCHHSGSRCNCQFATATMVPALEVSMPWLSSSSLLHPTEPMSPFEDISPTFASDRSGWSIGVQQLPTPGQGTENPHDMTASADEPMEPKGTYYLAVDELQSQPVPDAGHSFAEQAPGTAEVTPVSHLAHPGSGSISPACCSYAGDKNKKVPQDAPVAQVADGMVVPMAVDVSFGGAAHPGKPYSCTSAYNHSYVLSSPAHPVGSNTPLTPPESAGDPCPSPVIRDPMGCPIPAFQHPIERGPIHGQFPTTRPEDYVSATLRPVYPARSALAAAADPSCNSPYQQRPIRLCPRHLSSFVTHQHTFVPPYSTRWAPSHPDEY